jgi:MFS family permease
LAGPMLQQRGYPSPLALTTLNQFSEIIFMFSMPWFVARLGLKRVLAIGMLAWSLRYFCFLSPAFPLALLGLFLHGFCYSFLYVGAYMYVDRSAPADLKASAQSLMGFLLLGLGFFMGAKLAGYMLDRFPAEIASMPAAEVGEAGPGTGRRIEKAPLPAWNDPHAAASAWRYLDLSGTISSLISGKQPELTPDLAQKLDADQDGVITMAEVQAAPEAGLQLGGLLYARDDLVATFQKIATLKDNKVADDDIRLTRHDWLQAQSCKWEAIWFWPAIAVLVLCLFFVLAFRDKPSQTQPAG